MPLSVATMQTTIKSAMDAEYGPPDNAGQQAKFTKALAEALFTILTSQAVVASNGATLTGPAGGPLPITALPGVIS